VVYKEPTLAVGIDTETFGSIFHTMYATQCNAFEFQNDSVYE
jgi:hypothetical protein